MQAMFLPDTKGRPRFNTFLRTVFYTLAAANTVFCDLIPFRCPFSISNGIFFSENRIDPQVKILDFRVFDPKHDPNFPCFTGIYIREVRLFAEYGIDPLFLLFFLYQLSLCRHPDHLLILCIPKYLHPPICEELFAELFSSGCKKIHSLLLIMDRTDTADLWTSIAVCGGKRQDSDMLQLLQAGFCIHLSHLSCRVSFTMR